MHTGLPYGTLGTGETGYRVLLGGRLGRHPRLGMEVPGILSHGEVLDLVRRCLEFYKTNSRNGNRFSHVLESHLPDCLTHFVGQHSGIKIGTIPDFRIGLNAFLNTCHLKCSTDNGLSLLLNTLQMRLVFETFGVNFINIFGAGWSGGEPAVFRDYF